MKKRFGAALVITLSMLLLTVCTLHLRERIHAAVTIPHTITVDFCTKGTVWKKRNLSSLESIPLSETDISSEQIGLMRSFAEKKYGASSLSLFLAQSISQTALGEIKDSIPLLRAFDQLSLSALLFLLCDEQKLSEIYLNRKTIQSHLTGFAVLSDAVYSRTIDKLNPQEFSSLFRFYCAPSKRNIDQSAYAAISRRAARLIAADDSFAGTAADYCEKELRRSSLWPPGTSITVETSIDPSRQRFLENTAVQCLRELKGQPPFRISTLRKLPPIETAALIIDIRTGEVLSMIGSISYGEKNKLNRCESRRQISSTFKPFLYAQAFEDGICTPETVFTDKPVISKNSDGTPWEPKNYYPYYIGDVKAGNALSLSINTVSVQLIDKVGIRRMADRSKRIFSIPGIESAPVIAAEPSLSLGSIDLSPLELAKGYLTLASGGEERFPHIVLKVTDAAGKVLWDRGRIKPERLFSSASCAALIPVLQNVVRTGTASKFIRDKFSFDAAGKSGSSPSDSWFAGFNPETLILVWAGYDIPSRSKEGKIPEFTIIPFWYSLMSAEKPEKTKF
jgi:membrane carboxypeptidase/penicillin-binding protein